MQMKTTVRHYI